MPHAAYVGSVYAHCKSRTALSLLARFPTITSLLVYAVVAVVVIAASTCYGVVACRYYLLNAHIKITQLNGPQLFVQHGSTAAMIPCGMQQLLVCHKLQASKPTSCQ